MPWSGVVVELSGAEVDSLMSTEIDSLGPVVVEPLLVEVNVEGTVVEWSEPIADIGDTEDSVITKLGVAGDTLGVLCVAAEL
jgi:hypothetical protein